MLSLEDPEWHQYSANYTNGTRVAELLTQAGSGEAPAGWYGELFQELFHQYTVSEAEYPAAPHLLRLAHMHEDVCVDLLVLLGACHAFSDPSNLNSLPEEIVEEWNISAIEAVPLIAKVLQEKRPNPSELLHLMVALAATGGYPALARAIEAVDYQKEG